MKVWIDADACPVVVKDILYRAAERNKLQLMLVSNQALNIPKSIYISKLQVAAGFDEADKEIVKRIAAGDLLITADIPLAADALAKQAHVLSPRGECFSTDTIRARLSLRDFMETLRASGIDTGGPSPYSHSDRQAFANQLDRIIRQYNSKQSD